jgi:hypothetical protein
MNTEIVKDSEADRKARNRRNWETSQRRIDRYYETIRENVIQIVPPKHNETNLPVMLRGAIDKLIRVKGDYSLLHFTIQLGRLRIELSRAKGTMGDRWLL